MKSLTKPYGETVSTILDGFRRGGRRIGYQSRIAFGAERILARLAHAHPGRVLWVTPTSIVEQSRDEMSALGVTEIGTAKAPLAMTVDSYAAVASRLSEIARDAFDLVILNERWREMNPLAERIVEHFETARVLDQHNTSHDFGPHNPHDMIVFTSGNGAALLIPEGVAGLKRHAPAV